MKELRERFNGSFDTEDEERGRERHGRGVLHGDVRCCIGELPQVRGDAVHILDGEGCLISIFLLIGIHKRSQILQSRAYVSHNREAVLARMISEGNIFDRAVQPAQIRRLDNERLRRRLPGLRSPEFSRRRLHRRWCWSEGAPVWCLHHHLHGGETCRWHDSLNMCVQQLRECVADSTDYRLVRPYIPVKLI